MPPTIGVTTPIKVRNIAAAASHQLIVSARSSRSSRLSSLKRRWISTSVAAAAGSVLWVTDCSTVCADRIAGPPVTVDAIAIAAITIATTTAQYHILGDRIMEVTASPDSFLCSASLPAPHPTPVSATVYRAGRRGPVYSLHSLLYPAYRGSSGGTRSLPSPAAGWPPAPQGDVGNHKGCPYSGGRPPPPLHNVERGPGGEAPDGRLCKRAV